MISYDEGNEIIVMFCLGSLCVWLACHFKIDTDLLC